MSLGRSEILGYSNFLIRKNKFKYDLLLDVVVIGYYVPDLDRITLIDIRADLINPKEYINITYAPDMNVKLEKNTLLELGDVQFI